MSRNPGHQLLLRLTGALILSAGLLLPLPANAANKTPSQLLIPLIGNNACFGRRDPNIPLGVQIYGDSGSTSPLFPLLVTSGAAWLRVVANWNAIEPDNSDPVDYNWSSFDSAVAASVQGCMNIVATIDHTADWAATHETVPPYPNRSPIRAANLADFAQFVGALVERYDGDGINDAPTGAIVDHWELYNEPDYGSGPDGGGWGNDSERYAQVLALIYPVLKAANPNAKLVFGGIAFDGFQEHGGPFVRSFLENVLKAGGGNNFDIMNFHYYPAFRGGWTTTNGSGLPEKTRAIQGILQEHGLQKPFVVTEAGWHSNPQATYPSSDETQSRYVAQFFTQAASLDFDFLIWWTFSDSIESSGHKTGLVAGATPPATKMSYTVFQTVAVRIGQAQYAGALTAVVTKNVNLEVYRFRDPTDKTLYVAWVNPVDTEEVAPLSLAGIRAVVFDKSDNLISTVNDADDGAKDRKIEVEVGGSPVYIVVE